MKQNNHRETSKQAETNRQEMKEEMTLRCLKMVPDTLDALRDVIMDPNTNPVARVQAIALVLDRGLGRPEENIRIQNTADAEEEALTSLEEFMDSWSERNNRPN